MRIGTWGYNWTNKGYTDANGALFPRQTENATDNIYGTYNGQRYDRSRDQAEGTVSYVLDRFLGVSHDLTFGFLTEKERFSLQTYPYLDNALLTFNSTASAPDFTTFSQVTLYNGQITVPVTPLNRYRQDDVSLLDVRIEKQFKFGERFKIGAFFDAFNIFNGNAAQTQDNITGRRTATVNGNRVDYQRFLSPTNVIAPRIFRIGDKFTF